MVFPFSICRIEDINGQMYEWRASGYQNDLRSCVIYDAFKASLSLPGDVAEFGAAQCETSSELARYLETFHIKKRVHIFESFEGLLDWSEQDNSAYRSLCSGLYATCREVADWFLAERSQYVLHKGRFTQFMDFDTPLCFAHVDADLYQPTREALSIVKQCLVSGGLVILDDYGADCWPGVKAAADELIADWEVLLEPAGSAQRVMRKPV